MKIEILGGGCAKCAGLKQTVQQAVHELNIQAVIETVLDPERLAHYHAISLPMLVIDGAPQKTSRLDLETIKTLLQP